MCAERWLITDLFTGMEKEAPSRQDDPSSPTQAWIQGWEACMNMDSLVPENPYAPSTLEYHDWNDGWNAAEED